MRQLTVRVSDDVYFDLVKQAANDRKEVDEYVSGLARGAVGIENENQPYETFEEFVRDVFDLSSGGKTTANVLGVVERMRSGMSWQDAVRGRAEQYAEENSEIESAEVYEDTVRDSCTRRIGMKTGQFKEKVNEIVLQFDGDNGGFKTTTPDPQKQPYALTRSKSDKYIIHVSDYERRIKTFGEEGEKDQAEVMADVVNFLIKEYDLIDQISVPYVVQKKALLNDQPTYPDGNEKMRHYKELLGGYYLDTHYKKEDKRRRLEELAAECNLHVGFEGAW